MGYTLRMEITAQRGAVAIMLDRPRVLFFDLAATWLLVERYGMNFVYELYSVQASDLTLKSKDALMYFLWAGLQAELAGSGETVTLEDAAALIHPWNIVDIFYATVKALTGAISAPALPAVAGKAEAARPAAKRVAQKATPKKRVPKKPGKTKASTFLTRSALRTRR